MKDSWPTIVCLICKQTFQVPKWQLPRKYCSVKCTANSRVRPKDSFTCHHCGIEFEDFNGAKNRKYCSRKCLHKSYHTRWKPSYSSIRRRFEERNWIKECQNCGYKEHSEILGIHHIDQNRKNNNLNNLMILCPNCHSLEHRKHIVH